MLSDKVTLAYIAGFLDGDGSVNFQLVKLKDRKYGFQVRASIAFYQSDCQAEVLFWIKDQFGGVGYTRTRHGNMTDYVVTSRSKVGEILIALQPYVRVKAKQIALALRILDEWKDKPTPEEFLRLCGLIDQFAEMNYSKNREHTAQSVRQAMIDKNIIVPVETSSEMMGILGKTTRVNTPTAANQDKRMKV